MTITPGPAVWNFPGEMNHGGLLHLLTLVSATLNRDATKGPIASLYDSVWMQHPYLLPMLSIIAPTGREPSSIVPFNPIPPPKRSTPCAVTLRA